MKNIALGATVAVVAVAAVAMAAPKSGLKAGEGITPFHPTHIVGPLADSTKCFPCTYQNRPQIQAWVNGDSMDNVIKMAKGLEKAVEANKSRELKAMIVMIAPKSEWAAKGPKIKAMAKANNINDVAIAMLEPTDKAIQAYKFNVSSEVKNTVFFYKNWKVSKTAVNWKADQPGMTAFNSALQSIL